MTERLFQDDTDTSKVEEVSAGARIVDGEDEDEERGGESDRKNGRGDDN